MYVSMARCLYARVRLYAVARRAVLGHDPSSSVFVTSLIASTLLASFTVIGDPTGNQAEEFTHTAF